MLEFRDLQSKDYKVASPVMSQSGFLSTESGFAALFMWRNFYKTQICIDDGTVFFRSVRGDEPFYLFPYGGDTKNALLKIKELETASGRSVKLFSLTEETRRKTEEIFPGEFEFEESRNSFDYVYRREALATLSGKNYHQKRNHVNKFIKKYDGRFEYCAMRADMADEIITFQKKWVNMASDKEGASTLNYETGAVSEMLALFDEFNLRGGILRVDGEICAYCIASEISRDVVDVMVEKADYSRSGAYQVINKMFAEQTCSDVKYINREEDMGIEGLRRAKLSYYPEFLVKKYGAIWKS